MDPKEKLQLLKAVRLLEAIPEGQLATLGEFLTPVEFADGAVIFEEGGKGDSLFFVTGGRVRISKRVAAGEMKDLAILGPGDCLAMVTDGVTESESASGEEFGDDRVLSALRVAPPTAAGAVAAILGAVEKWMAAGKATDDLTILALKAL